MMEVHELVDLEPREHYSYPVNSSHWTGMQMEEEVVVRHHNKMDSCMMMLGMQAEH